MRRPHISRTSLQTVSSYINIFMHILCSKCCFAENLSNPLSAKNPKPWSSKSLDLGPGSMFFKGWIATTHVMHPIFCIYPRPGFCTRISSSGMGSDWNMNIKRSNKISKVDVDDIKRISNECKSGQNIKRSGPNVFSGWIASISNISTLCFPNNS